MPLSKKLQPFWSAPGAALYLGDVRGCLRQLPTRSVHCCVTSPPYWGLRDYGTGTWEGGSAECDHDQRRREKDQGSKESDYGGIARDSLAGRNTCRKCGATRTDHQIGMEDTPEEYIANMVNVFSEVRRVLRDDGTVYLNLGDTFDGGQQLIPARAALALVADGWRLVQDIIWSKPNSMPESVTNRCTKSHEHIFLLAKGTGYYFDSVAIQEPGKSVREDSVNKRDVWIVPTRGYPGAHFAVFSPELITPCILAGTSEHGCCVDCGSPYERVVTRIGGVPNVGYSGGDPPPGIAPLCGARKRIDDNRDRSFEWSRNGKPDTNSTLDGTIATRETVGWRKACGCQAADVAPCTVLDPFCGSGTTVATALQLGRAGIGIDLSEVYLRENAVPRIEAAMRGERVGRRTVVVPADTPPAARRLR